MCVCVRAYICAMYAFGYVYCACLYACSLVCIAAAKVYPTIFCCMTEYNVQTLEDFVDVKRAIASFKINNIN